MAIRGSAAWYITIVLVTTFLVGAIFLTAADPLFQAFFNSAFWSADIQILSDLLSWGEALGGFLAFFLLLGFLSRAWIWTRRAG